MPRPRAPSSSPSSSRRANLILDSGAYSAFRLGKQIDLQGYCDYIKMNEDWIGHYVNMDVINPKDPPEAARASFENLKFMRAQGLNPVAVFHAGEDIQWLYRMLDMGCDYVGLAASAMTSRNKVNDWYSLAWDHLVTSGGKPIVQVHAFGEGRLGAMQDFPWTSSDSTSWVYDAQRNGATTLPGGHKVTHRNDGRHTAQAQDVNSMEGADKIAFEAILKRLGIEVEGFADRGSGTALMMRTYVSLMDCFDKQDRVRAHQPVIHHPPGLFERADHGPKRAIADRPFDYHLVIGNNPWAASAIAFGGYQNILASYYYVSTMPGMDRPYRHLKDFVLDPRGYAHANPPFKGSYDMLARHVKHPERTAA